MSDDGLLSLLPQLDSVIVTITKDSSDEVAWQKVESVAKSIADGLRSKDGPVDNHTQLGASSLPQSLATLVKLSVSDTRPTPKGPTATAIYELLRVGANLCMDHDGNRQRLLDVGYTTSVVSLLDSYWDLTSSQQQGSQMTSTSDLKIIKTAIGALLNSSMGFEPAKSALIASGVHLTILRLSLALYNPTAWAAGSPSPENSEPKARLEEWEWRSGLSNWSWRAIEVLTQPAEQDQEQDHHVEHGKPAGATLDARALPSLLGSLKGFIPPFPASTATSFGPASSSAFIKADLDVLEEVSMNLESLALDSSDVRQAVAKSVSLEEPSAFLRLILDFVEKGAPPTYWKEAGDAKSHERWEKSLGLCKAAVIKAIVTIAGDEDNLELLWENEGPSATKYPGGWFVERMANWIKNFSKDTKASTSRDDLAICGSLVLGNLSRKESRCIAIVQPPISLVPDLLPLLTSDMDIKIKHGAIGLLKHISQSPANKALLGDAGILEGLAASKVWEKSGDMAEVVQVSAIGAAKHLCNNNLNNALRLISSPEATATTGSEAELSGVDQIVDLVKRSDSLVLQSEGTRVLVNVIKSLWSPAPAPASTNGVKSGTSDATRRREAIEKIANLDSTELLVEMIARSAKYPILLNEGVVALTLLSSHPAGIPCVLHSLLTTLPFNISASGNRAPGSPPKSTTLDMLKAILRNPDKAFPPELRANVCSLLASACKVTSTSTEGSDAAKVRAAMTQDMQTLAKSADESEPKVKSAAQKALDLWAPAST